MLIAPASAVATPPTCQVLYKVTNDWSSGFQGSIDITNNGPALSSWTFGFAFLGDQKVSSGWNGIWTQSGHNVTVTNASWNGTLGANASMTLGFTATYSGTNESPALFTFNGVDCNGPSQPPGPTVSITNPSGGQAFTAPATIPIDASAGESGGSISKVEFFAGTTLLGTATTSPYSITWSNVASGGYSLTAEAFDAAGNTATSAPVPITVGTGGGTTGPAPQLHVSGNQLVDSTGKTVVLHGVEPVRRRVRLRAGQRDLERADGPGFGDRDQELGRHRGARPAQRGVLERRVLRPGRLRGRDLPAGRQRST